MSSTNRGFSFGLQPQTQQSVGGFTGVSTTTSQPTSLPLLFGSQTGSNVTGTNTLSCFGNKTTASAPFSGLMSTQPATSVTAGVTGSSFMGLPASSTTTGLSTGVALGTSVAPSLGGFGLGQSGLNVTTSIPTTSAPIGLGGVDLKSTGAASGKNESGKNDSKTIKETLLPNEISITLESFKKYVKDQKLVREEISRVSSKNILKVQDETAALKQLLSEVSNGLQRNAVAIQRMKEESAQELKDAEIAHRTKDTPPALQFENTAPTGYFQRIVSSFEKQMHTCRQQIEQLERHLMSLSQPSLLSPQELTLIIKRLYETFIALAAQVQTVNEAVQNQKDQFLAFRRQVHGDNVDIFNSQKKIPTKTTNYMLKHPITVGPAPFSTMPSAAAVAMATALNRTQQPSGLQGTQTLSAQSNQSARGLGPNGFGTGLGTSSAFGSGGSLFGGSNLSFGSSSTAFKPLGSYPGGSGLSMNTFGSTAPGTPLPVQNETFQLQKPPLGNKRGKRWTSA
ncbi:nucleoporin p58/p45-like [Tachypleus tridentatus]|uniref:nucleoporin p58/p45-like n=1 Tax=Tachypleus tridentatus TaxID=6853 RepID=UPI003FD35FFD